MTHDEFLKVLENRFNTHPERRNELDWKAIEEKLRSNPEKIEILLKMESSGGEPDVVKIDENSGEFIFIDCSTESPGGRRSLCYDRAALGRRKENKSTRLNSSHVK